MKSTTPESSTDILIQCFIDPAEWATARWVATVLTYHAPSPNCQELPGIGLAFENFEAGKRIFDGWIKRIGNLDLHEELRICIIEARFRATPMDIPCSSHPTRSTPFIAGIRASRISTSGFPK